MYARRTIDALGEAKAALRHRIAAGREANVEAARGVVRPLVWLDLALALWRQLSPLVRANVLAHDGAGVTPQSIFRRIWRAFWRWSPLVASLVRTARRARFV